MRVGEALRGAHLALAGSPSTWDGMNGKEQGPQDLQGRKGVRGGGGFKEICEPVGNGETPKVESWNFEGLMPVGMRSGE